MSETIGEMILPGTYIDVRSEGLIGVSGIATGNVGVVGTADRGPLDEVVVLDSFATAQEVYGAADAWPGTQAQPALTLVRTLEQVFRGGASSVYAVRVANAVDMASTAWSVLADDETELFTLEALTPGTWADAIALTITQEGSGKPFLLRLKHGKYQETYAGQDAGALAAALADTPSRLVRASGPADAAKAKLPKKQVEPLAPTTHGGPNGQTAGAAEVAIGLEKLAREAVNLVVVGGLCAKDIAGAVLAHLEQTENDGKERLAVLGASKDEPADLLKDDAAKLGSGRVVLVAPGIRVAGLKLDASYAAALVAGKLASLAPHVSLTNKDLPADALTREYSRAEQKQLLNGRTLVLHKNLGLRVLKGITTEDGAFRQVSVRRIVDYAKAGVRVGANPYIGRLNNSRVRAALKATLDGFLSGMVLDEMLVGYTLDVSATRRQEIEGQAIVTMTLRPTFSIDFVKVIMNLQ